MAQAAWWELPALLLVALSVRLPWLFTIPISQAPDEGAHWWVVHFILTNRCLPNFQEMAAVPGAAYYGALPPLGYLPHLFCAALSSAENMALGARVGSLLMGLVTVACAFGIGRILFAKAKLWALALPLAVAFHPQLVFVNAYTNSDSTASALAALCLWITLSMLRTPARKAFHTMACGITVGVLLLSKYSAYCVLPAVAAGLILAQWSYAPNVVSALVVLLSVGAIASSLAAWWFVHSYCAFAGDWMGLKTMLHLHDQAYHEPPPLYSFPAFTNANWRATVLMSYWGMFGNLNRLLPQSAYRTYSIFMLVSGGGWAIALSRSALFAGLNQKLPRLKLDAVEVSCWLVLALAAICNLAGLVAASVSINATGSPQGRYLFPAEIAYMALLLGGFRLLGKRAGSCAALAFLLYNAVVCLNSWVTLALSYGLSTVVFR